MPDTANLLLDLKQDLEDADEFLARASNLGCELLGDDPERGDPGWPLMGDVLTTIGDLQQLLRVTLHRPELVEAFKQAQADLDHLSDLAYGASY